MGEPTTSSPANGTADGAGAPSVLDRAVEALAFAADTPLAPAEAARIVASVTGAETTVADVDAAAPEEERRGQAGSARRSTVTIEAA